MNFFSLLNFKTYEKPYPQSQGKGVLSLRMGDKRSVYICLSVIVLITLVSWIFFRIFSGKSLNPFAKSVMGKGGALDLKTRRQNEYNRVKTLTDQGKITNAWQLYVKTSNQEQDSFSQEVKHLPTWYCLPPEELICKQIEFSENISIIPVALIRDCAIAYPNFCQKCLQDDILWKYLNPYPDYIVDIGKKHPYFAFHVMTSRRGTDIGNEYCLELFNAGYQEMIKSIRNKTIIDEQMRWFGFFLFRYESVIPHDDFNKIKVIGKIIQETQRNEDYELMINFVLGKLLLQGVYKNEEKLLQSFQDQGIANIFALIHNVKIGEIRITKILSGLKMDEDIQKAITFLYLLPRDASNYYSGRMVAGQIWMDNNQFFEAGKCFLDAAIEFGRDSLFLAATCLLAKNSQGEFVSRQADDEDNIILLTHAEISELSAHKNEFFAILKKVYGNSPDLITILALFSKDE